MKTLRILSLIALVISAAISLDLLFHLLGNLIPEMNDGLGLHSVLLGGHLYFGDHTWSMTRFYDAFVTGALITLAVFIENIVLSIIDILKK